MTVRDSVRVSAAEVGRNFGEWQSRAITAPVVITHHGRDRLVLSSMQDFQNGAKADDGLTAGLELEINRHKLHCRALLQHISECFLSIDSNLKLVDANNRAELYFGLSLDSMRDKDLRDLEAFDSDSVAWEYYSRVVHLTQEPVRFMVASTLHPGCTLAITAFPFEGDIGVLFSSTNAHDEALHRLREERAVVAAVSADPILSQIRLNLRGGITNVDGKFSTLSGFPESQLASMMLAELLHPHDRSAVARTLDKALRDGSSCTVSARLLAKDGDIHQVRLNFSAVKGDLHPDAAVAIAVDLGVEPTDAAARADKGRSYSAGM